MSDDKDRAQDATTGAGVPRAGEVYEHYKGGIYSIVAVSIKEDTLIPLVTYHSNVHGTDWTRTLADFTDFVEWPTEGGGAMAVRRPRFRRVMR
jgi:hypothetical protein